MSNNLSHSSASKFQDCAMAYKFHYVERLRSNIANAALLFGSAVDQGIQVLLTEKDKDPYEAFDKLWTFQAINDVVKYLPTNTDIVYANSDYDEDLLSHRDVEKLAVVINELYPEGVDCSPLEFVKKIYEEKEYSGFSGLPDKRKGVLNYANWLCLHHKGRLMIKAVQDKILPNVVEVLGVQTHVKLENDNGDKIVGYADLVCRYNYKGEVRTVIFDFKTSSREYEEDSVLTSPQLTLYVHALSEQFDNTRTAGFIVLHKNVKKNKKKVCTKCGNDGSGKRHKTCDAVINEKRCNSDWNETINPEIYVQVIINNIPEKTEEIVLDNMDYINQAITNGVFHRNFSACVKPWGKCPYFKKCYEGSEEGLIKMPERIAK